MYHSFERIITDTMYACEAYNTFTNDDNDMVLDNIIVDDDWMVDPDDLYDGWDNNWPEDFQGEEDFA